MNIVALFSSHYIEDCREFNRPKDEVVARITMKFKLSNDEALDAVDEYWEKSSINY